MGRRGCPWNPCMGKRRKISCKGKRTNNPITESKTEVGTHISMGGIVCPSQNWASLHIMNSMSAFPLQVLLIPKHCTPRMQQYLFSLLHSPLPQQSRNKVWKVFLFTGGSLANYMMNCWRQPDSLGAADRTKIPSSAPRAKPNSGQVKGK